MTARPRSRASAKKAGTAHETAIADYLAQHVDDRIERRTRNGGKDRGDLSGIRLSPALGGGRVVAELKNTGKIALGPWQAEAEAERGNDDATVAVVISKRHGVGDPGRQWVTCTVDDPVAYQCVLTAALVTVATEILEPTLKIADRAGVNLRSIVRAISATLVPTDPTSTPDSEGPK